MSELLLLRKLKAMNFRSIKEQEFEFHDLSVLIGNLRRHSANQPC